MQLLERDCRTSQGRINSSARTGRVPTSSTHTAQGLVGEGCPDTASAPLEPDLDAALIGDAAKMAATYISDSTVMDVMSCLSTLTEVAPSKPLIGKLAYIPFSSSALETVVFRFAFNPGDLQLQPALSCT